MEDRVSAYIQNIKISQPVMKVRHPDEQKSNKRHIPGLDTHESEADMSEKFSSKRQISKKDISK